jgi:predicted ATP-grasp superfamily ATP-dependent carboligase
MGDYYGTLAAARCYGRANIPVTLAASKRLTQTRWSRFVDQTVQAPDPSDTEAFEAWLLEFGKHQPGMFLYPTSDDMAWLLASRQEQLREYYRMLQPPLSTIVSLLDKRRLYAACGEVGIDIPETLFPDSPSAFAALRGQVHLPTLIKPRTQMLLDSKLKGRVVRSAQELEPEYHRFRLENVYREAILAFDPSISWPMLQRYHPEATVDTYSLSGFIDRTGEVFVVRAARKVFQRPRRLGVGLCFVSDVEHVALSRKVYELCRQVGYFGAFETEFVHVGERYLLIDFNPRFYGQMAFEVARGMPLPLLVYDAAHALDGHAPRAPVGPTKMVGDPERAYHFSNRWVLELALLTQRLSGRLLPSERQAIRRLLDAPGSTYVDAVRDPADRGPWAADILINLEHFGRHPRDFMRKFFLDA